MITRERLYELLKTILDGRVFGFDDDLCIIKVKVPVDPNDVKGLSDFVKSMLKNTCRPFPIPDVDRHIGDGSFKIFGDFVDHDESLEVGVDGRLGVVGHPFSRLPVREPETFDAVVSIREVPGGFEATTRRDGVARADVIRWPRPPKPPAVPPELLADVEKLKADVAEIKEKIDETKGALDSLRKYVSDELRKFIRW